MLNTPPENKTDLETMEQWIADGCYLENEEGDPIGQAEKVPWVSTHPDFPTASGEERETMVADAKALIANLSYADIDAHIETIFSNLSVVQKASLKKLYKATLFLLKK